MNQTTTYIGGKQITSADQFKTAITNFNKENPPQITSFLSLFQLKVLLSRYAAVWLCREGSLDVQVNLTAVLTDLAEGLGLSKKDLKYILSAELVKESELEAEPA